MFWFWGWDALHSDSKATFEANAHFPVVVDGKPIKHALRFTLLSTLVSTRGMGQSQPTGNSFAASSPSATKSTTSSGSQSWSTCSRSTRIKLRKSLALFLVASLMILNGLFSNQSPLCPTARGCQFRTWNSQALVHYKPKKVNIRQDILSALC